MSSIVYIKAQLTIATACGRGVPDDAAPGRHRRRRRDREGCQA